MKLSIKITGLFLTFVLLTSCVAATENKDLPTKEEITDFIAGIPVTDNYINTVYDAVVNNHPSWNCDIWKDKNGNQLLSLYYADSGSAKGYGSIYFNEFGKEVSADGVEIDPVPIKSYVGKAAEENIDNTVQIADGNDQTGYKTVNKALPTRKEINDFIAGITVPYNYIDTVYDAVVNNHPSWNCDVWKDKNGNQLLSLYYADPGSAKGYGSIYFNEFGKEVSTGGVEIDPVPIKSYVGKTGSEGNVDNNIQTNNNNIQTTDNNVQTTDEKDQTAEYDKKMAEYQERLDEYEKRLDEYENDKSVKYDQPTKYKNPTDYKENKPAEYEKLLAEYKELLDEYKKVQKIGDVTPPTKPEETKLYKEIYPEIIGGLIVTYIASKLHWNKN